MKPNIILNFIIIIFISFLCLYTKCIIRNGINRNEAITGFIEKGKDSQLNNDIFCSSSSSSSSLWNVSMDGMFQGSLSYSPEEEKIFLTVYKQTEKTDGTQMIKINCVNGEMEIEKEFGSEMGMMIGGIIPEKTGKETVYYIMNDDKGENVYVVDRIKGTVNMFDEIYENIPVINYVNYGYDIIFPSFINSSDEKNCMKLMSYKMSDGEKNWESDIINCYSLECDLTIDDVMGDMFVISDTKGKKENEVMKIDPSNGKIERISMGGNIIKGVSQRISASYMNPEQYYFIQNVQTNDDDVKVITTLFAFDRKNDEMVWKTPIKGPAEVLKCSDISISSDGLKLQFVCPDWNCSHFHIVDSRSGKILVQEDLDWAGCIFTNRVNDKVIVSCNLLSVHRYDLHFYVLDDNGKITQTIEHENANLISQPLVDEENYFLFYCYLHDNSIHDEEDVNTICVKTKVN